jgi:signal transduction histidine kinase
VKGGLFLRTAVASALLALTVAAAFAVLLMSVAELRGAADRARRTEQVLIAANRLERLILDLETGQRGYLLTGRPSLLEPWRQARAAVPGEAERLAGLVAGDAEQRARAGRIAADAASYVQDYSVPLVSAVQQGDAVDRAAATVEGNRRVDAMRRQFDGLVAAEQARAVALEEQEQATARTAILASIGGLGGSAVLILVFAGYLTRAIVRPVRQVATMAGRLAAGDLTTRIPERGTGEIGTLERSFNSMAASLERGRRELDASRLRIVAAGDQARRRIERDLHDGTQQRLVSLVLNLRAAQAAVPEPGGELNGQLDRIADGLTAAVEELRELSRGIHPAVLSEGGLPPALKALARRSTVPVTLSLDVPERLPDAVEIAAYYVVSEALANVAKHARATHADVSVTVDAGRLRLSVTDDGVGGAAPGPGSGIAGLADRVQALGGTLTLSGPTGQGTRLAVDLPVRPPASLPA